jgi:hypothetical protein
VSHFSLLSPLEAIARLIFLALGPLALYGIFIRPWLRIPVVSLTHDAGCAVVLAPPLAAAGFLSGLQPDVLVYQYLEGLRWQDALFWIINPQAIEYRRVRDAMKFFSILVYFGVFAFLWVTERPLITVFNRQSVEAWRTMVNHISIDKLRDHFIIRGYGQWDELLWISSPGGDSLRARRNQREPLPRTPQG